MIGQLIINALLRVLAALGISAIIYFGVMSLCMLVIYMRKR